MRNWKKFFPKQMDLAELKCVKCADYFVDGASDPRWETCFFQKKGGGWISLTWDYFDVEFKFEIYGVSMGCRDSVPDSLVKVGVVPTFSKIALLLHTEWRRPAGSGEVPAGFEPIIEEGGRFADVPDTAISAGTVVCGIVFQDVELGPRLVISVDTHERYSLKVSSDANEIARLLEKYDAMEI